MTLTDGLRGPLRGFVGTRASGQWAAYGRVRQCKWAWARCRPIRRRAEVKRRGPAESSGRRESLARRAGSRPRGSQKAETFHCREQRKRRRGDTQSRRVERGLREALVVEARDLWVRGPSVRRSLRPAHRRPAFRSFSPPPPSPFSHPPPSLATCDRFNIPLRGSLRLGSAVFSAPRLSPRLLSRLMHTSAL